MALKSMDIFDNPTIGRHAMEVLDRLRKELGSSYPGWEERTLAAWREEAENIIRTSGETEEQELAKLRRPLKVEEHKNITGYIEFLQDLRRDARRWIQEIDEEQQRLDEEAEEEKRLQEERAIYEMCREALPEARKKRAETTARLKKEKDNKKDNEK
jgi:hypothetical protein